MEVKRFWFVTWVEAPANTRFPSKNRALYCRLTSSLLHCIYSAICLLVLIFANEGVAVISRGSIFANERDFTAKYTKISGIIFWFCFSGVNCFCKEPQNLQNCKISYTQKYCDVRKGFRISIFTRTLPPPSQSNGSPPIAGNSPPVLMALCVTL